jgi:hypothetical protein
VVAARWIEDWNVWTIKRWRARVDRRGDRDTADSFAYALNVSASKAARLEAFYARLAQSPAAADADNAYELLSRVLTAVEDEMSGVPADPSQWKSDGRLYPPQDDNRTQVIDRPDIRRYRQFKHITYIAANGAIEIATLSREVVFRKAGADGRHVWET